MKRLLLLLTLSGVAFFPIAHAQTESQREMWAKAEQAYGLSLDGAEQVIIYAPLLSDGSFVNSIKAPLNLGVPVTLVTTEQGIKQRNGHIFSLVLLGAKTVITPGRPKPGDKIHYQVQQPTGGWKIYDFTSKMPKEIPYRDVRKFNAWYASNSASFQFVDPVSATVNWAKINTGQELNYNGLPIKWETPSAP